MNKLLLTRCTSYVPKIETTMWLTSPSVVAGPDRHQEIAAAGPGLLNTGPSFSICAVPNSSECGQRAVQAQDIAQKAATDGVFRSSFEMDIPVVAQSSRSLVNETI